MVALELGIHSIQGKLLLIPRVHKLLLWTLVNTITGNTVGFSLSEHLCASLCEFVWMIHLTEFCSTTLIEHTECQNTLIEQSFVQFG